MREPPWIMRQRKSGEPGLSTLSLLLMIIAFDY